MNARNIAAAVALVGVLVPGSARVGAQDGGDPLEIAEQVRELLFGDDSGKRAPEALAILEKHKPRFGPDDIFVWHTLVGYAHASIGNVKECLAALDAAAAAAPEGAWGVTRSRAIFKLANRRMAIGDLRGALAAFAQSERHIVAKDRDEWYARQGVCHEWLGEPEKALALYDKAIELTPDSWCRGYRAKFHHLFGRWDEARADLDADRELCEQEKTTGRKDRLRVIVDGPYRERWPHGWRKLELRSKYGHYHIVSQAGVSDSEMNAIEAKCAKLDPGKPADLKKIESLCAPSTELVTVATLMELMRSEYMKLVDMKEKEWPAGRVFKVFYFETQPDFEAFNVAQGSPSTESMLGYYQPGLEFLALFDNIAGGKRVFGITEKTMDTFFHEGWHQFYDVIAHDPPTWLNEGLATMLGATKILDGGRKLNVAALVKTYPDPRYQSRYQVIKEAVRGGTHVTWRTFVRQTRDEWDKVDTNLRYSQAWSLCYYAMRGNNAAFRKDFLEFFWGTTKGRPSKELVDEIFPDAKLDAYEKAWLEYMKKL